MPIVVVFSIAEIFSSALANCYGYSSISFEYTLSGTLMSGRDFRNESLDQD